MIDRLGVRLRARTARGARAAKLLCAWLAIASGAGAAGVLSARARAHELVQEAGPQLRSWTRGLPAHEPRTLRVNGAALQLAHGRIEAPVEAVLDAFHARCRANASVPALAPPLEGRRASSARGGGFALEPVIRGEHATGGYLGCLGRAPDGARAWLHALAAFAARGDLAALGDLRFVWATRDRAATAYLALASAGPLPLDALFPARGDAPGIDAPDLPRPPQSRRVLSAYQEHAAPFLVSYLVELDAAAALASYRGALIDGGFAVRELDGPAGTPRVLHVRGRGAAAVVVTQSGARNSTVTVLPLEAAEPRTTRHAATASPLVR